MKKKIKPLLSRKAEKIMARIMYFYVAKSYGIKLNPEDERQLEFWEKEFPGINSKEAKQ